MAKSPKRGYSRTFARKGTRRVQYLLDYVPPGLMRRAKAKSKRTGISIREVLLTRLDVWVTET